MGNPKRRWWNVCLILECFKYFKASEQFVASREVFRTQSDICDGLLLMYYFFRPDFKTLFSKLCMIIAIFSQSILKKRKKQQQPLKVFYKKGFFNFTKFTEKYICRNLFFVKVVGLRPVNLLKRDSQRGFFCKFCKILEHLFNRTRLGAVSENPKEYWHWKKCRSLKNVNQVVFNELFPCSNKIKFEQKKLKEDA